MSQARQDGITLRQWLPLIGLTCCAFVFNTSEFMPIGLLTDIAASFSLTEAQAGIMISVYAWGVMLLSLPLMVFASRFEFKRMLLGVLAVFSLGQFLSAVAPTYPILVCARLVVACAHAVFWSVASIMASRLVDTRHGALAISMIATGSSIAQIFGLPLGRAIGLAVGWRMTFAVVGALSAVAVVYQATMFPTMPAGERFTLKQLPELLKNPFLIALYVVTVFMATGYYAGYSYIEPFLAQVAHVDASAITMTLTAFGCSGLLGSWLFGRLFDGHRFPFLAITLSGVPVALLLMGPAASSLAAALAVCALWGCCATAFNVAFQAELIKHSPPDSSIGSSNPPLRKKRLRHRRRRPDNGASCSASWDSSVRQTPFPPTATSSISATRKKGPAPALRNSPCTKASNSRLRPARSPAKIRRSEKRLPRPTSEPMPKMQSN